MRWRCMLTILTVCLAVFPLSAGGKSEKGKADVGPSVAPVAGRTALVIGNGEYAELGVLYNPPHDAADMGAALKALGFEVEVLINGDVVAMEDAIVRLGKRLSDSPGSVGFFFFAGHGVQYGGDNYLIPANARIASQSFLRSRAITVQEVLETMESGASRLNIVVLDACRDNPFGWARSGQGGLGSLMAQPPGSMVVYATGAGGVAGDGKGRNGIFTTELLKVLPQPGLDVAEIFRLTGYGVQQVTEGRQIPAIYSQFFGQEVLLPFEGLPQARPPYDINKLSVPLTYVEGGSFEMGYAKALNTTSQAVHTVELDGFYIGTYEITQRIWEQTVGANPSSVKGKDYPVDRIRWIDAIAFCNALSRRDGLEEVYTIVGEEAVCDWQKVGYRLPTEAEWEYAARGGTASQGYRYAGSNWADDVAWYGLNSKKTIHKVGTKQPNELGIYDMSGNVWEMCWDIYDVDYYDSSPRRNPTGGTFGAIRVIRGGSSNANVNFVTVYERSLQNLQYDYLIRSDADPFGLRVVLPLP